MHWLVSVDMDSRPLLQDITQGWVIWGVLPFNNTGKCYLSINVLVQNDEKYLSLKLQSQSITL